MAGRRYALQLYTVRQNLEEDVIRTLRAVKAIGYSHVETAGTAGLNPARFRTLLGENGLTPISSHLGFEEAARDVDAALELAQALGVRYLVISSLPGALTPDKAGWVQCARAMDAAGARLRAAGVRLCYHNHAAEFQKIEGEYIFDLLMKEADPANLAAQIDTFWVQYAHVNPIAVIEKYADRCPLLHVKDMLDRKSRAFAEVGQGILDWPGIFAAADKAGVQWYIVEQDVCARDPLDSAKMSLEFLLKN